MGKAQYKKKTSERRHNPIRVPDAHLGAGRADGKTRPDKERQLLPVLDKLRSPEYADRIWACAAISNLIQNDAATRRLFQGRNVVGELIERLSDSVDEVVVEASGALRNLAIDGGHELCGEMYNKGIMSHLTVLTGKISGTIDGVLAGTTKEADLSDAELQARKHLLDLTENVISLIWSLAEATHKTLAAVNAAAGIDGLLVKVLEGRDALSVGVVLAAAQALYSLTQDNAPFTKKLLYNPVALSTFVDMVGADHEQAERDLKGKRKAKNSIEEDDDLLDGRVLLTRVLMAGTLRNIVEPGSRADEAVGIVALTNKVILPLVNSLLDVNLGSVVERVNTLVAQLPEQEVPIVGKDLKTDHRPPAELKLERVERMLTAVAAALEVLTGICAGLEDAEEGMDEDAEADAADDDEEMEDALADEDLIALGRDPSQGGAGAAAPTVSTAATLPHLLGGLSLPERLSTLAQVTPLSFPPNPMMPSPHPPTTAALSVVHLRALEALNNLLLTSAAAIAGGDSSLAALIPGPGLWVAMFDIVTLCGADAGALRARGHEMRLEIMEAALGCVWGLAQTVPASLPVSAPQVQMLKDALPALSVEAGTRAIDTLAALASRPGVSVDENRAVGTWLLDLLASPPSTEAEVAVLNAIIDIYADEGRDYDRPVFVDGGFVTKLAASVARVRNDVRGIDRRKNLELRARGEEAYENLTAFIKYRRSLRL